ncbi:hypothetical protein [Streptomyces sp. NRRL B-24572]|uniref:hypothetical protein n=1 Tax=Streptomyces sp. NRRL B-24572 TaxID=1962156 RepID=UPI0015C516DB
MATTMLPIGLLYVVFVGVLLVLLVLPRGLWPIIPLIAGALFVGRSWFGDRMPPRRRDRRTARDEYAFVRDDRVGSATGPPGRRGPADRDRASCPP